MRANPIGIFGGTFDPVHFGHLRSAESLLDKLCFESIYLLPSATPPHRSPARVDSGRRLKMVELAVTGHPGLIADARECRRPGKSWTIDTLKSFRAEFPERPLAYIAGMDAYADMPNWKDGQAFLEYAHIVAMRRPGFSPDESWGNDRITHDPDQLQRQRHGLVYFADSAQYDISSTTVRKRLENSEDASDVLPAAVINYIKQHQLYAPRQTS